jgi:subtilisin family serine protease
MQRQLSLLAVALVTVAACGEVPSPVAPVTSGPSGVAAIGAPDSYIIVFNDDVADPVGAANGLARAAGASVTATYTAALKGFAANVPAAALNRISSDPRVKYVEPDGIMTAIAQTIPYGIIKVGANVSPTANAGDGQGAITNVNAYIIDTGIDVTHPDLNAVFEVNFAHGPNRDCNGHGTHVAGTVGARDNTIDVVGVAPGIRLHAVKVLNCAGSGTTSGVISGIDWVTAHAIKPAVANMSLGGGASQALDDAVRNSAASGVFYALAAGNSAADACTTSPARAGAGTNNGIMTVAATDINDAEASFSNFGPCVDIWAPGVNVLSTKNGGGTTTLSGTSMASPHGAGGGAVYLSTHTTASPSTVEAALKLAAQIPGTLSKDGRLIFREYIGTF